ncbi:hypothetical protein IKU74_07800 [bacterium]|nr:hypothetical protein [bacterium]
MIKAVSSVSFKGENDKDMSSLINSPGKFSSAPAATTQAPAADKVEFSTDKKEKNNTGLVIGGTLATLAALWIGLGIAVGKGKMDSWKLAEGQEGWGAKLKDYVYKFGESANKAYDATLGKWFGKKADDAAKVGDDAAKAGDDAAKAGNDAAKVGDDAAKVGEDAPKSEG